MSAQGGPFSAWLPQSWCSPGWKVLESGTSETQSRMGLIFDSGGLGGKGAGITIRPWVQLWRKCGGFWMTAHPQEDPQSDSPVSFRSTDVSDSASIHVRFTGLGFLVDSDFLGATE